LADGSALIGDEGTDEVASLGLILAEGFEDAPLIQVDLLDHGSDGLGASV
jgi:hypothetical protein